MSKLLLLFPLLLCSCTPFFSNQEIESACFVQYDSTPLGVFYSRSRDNQAFLWLLNHGGDDNNNFLKENKIKGYLMPQNITGGMKGLDYSTAITFTGRIFKLWPNWGAYNIGGVRKNLHLEVSINGEQYLLMENYINIDLKINLPKRCQFSE